MNDNQAKYPQLRFKGFTDPWEQRKLGDYYEFKNGLNKGKEAFGSGSPIVNFVDVFHNRRLTPNMLSGRVNLTDKEILNFEVQDGDLFFTRTSETIDEIGFPSVMDGSPKATTFSGFVLRGRAVSMDPLITSFKAYVFFTDAFRVEMKKKSSMTTRALTSGSALKKMFFNFPAQQDEQQKIGTFFQQLDGLITLHQRKLAKLKELKQGYLQKMFPKNGAKVPELRFAGFADAWEQCKLSDVANHRGGTAIEKYFDKDGVYKVISIGSYGLNSQYVDQNIRAISNEITDGRVVNSGELAMVLNDKTANGSIIGRTLLVEKDNEYVVNQRTEIISPKENFDSNFAYTILNGPFREKVKRIVQGGTQIYVNYPAVSNLDLELPKIEEQQKIGSFFKQLDDTIALHQRKLEKLRELKKGYLQKMFV